MRKTPTIASGVAIAAGGMLAAALVTPTLSASADGEGDGQHEQSSAARAFPPYSCDGGKNKRVWNHGMSSNFETIPSGTGKRVTQTIRFKGPKRGKDTLSVTVSGVTHNHTTSGGSEVEVTVNGLPMKPGEFNDPAEFSSGSTTSSNPEANTLQFCRKVNRGVKRVKVKFHAFSGDVHLEDTLVHAELNN